MPDSESRYRSLFENMNAGFVLFEVLADSNGGAKDLKIIVANKGFEKTTGLKASEVCGKYLSEMLPGIEKDEAGWIKIYGDVAISGKPKQFDEFSDLLGSYYSIRAYQPEPNQCAVTFVDISEKIKIEQERNELHEKLMQSQKMESIGRLAGGVAHDFNNMLGVILGYAEKLLDQFSPNDPVAGDLKQIIEAGNRSAALTKQLLTFSRKQAVRQQTLNINEIIAGLEQILRKAAGSKIDLQFALNDGELLIYADKGQIEQVIVNLVVNARDAMPSGGKLTITTKQFDVDASLAERHVDVGSGNYVKLSIADTGQGMTKEVIGKIFEPFFSTKEKDQGTGLGMSIVYGIVKQSRGFIDIHSVPGEGTEMNVFFPVPEKQPMPGGISDQKSVVRKEKQHLLVVEDELVLRNLLSTLFQAHGYTVTLAENGEEALAIVKGNKVVPDLIVTDVVMPKMNGAELTKALLEFDEKLKILLMSGYTDSPIEEFDSFKSENGFIQKPFTNKQIIEKVQRILGAG